MTDHHEQLRVAPDPLRAEDLRRRLHARLASGSGPGSDEEGSTPSERSGRADRGDVITLETERPGPDQLAVPRRPARSSWLLVAAAALVVAVVGGVLVTGADDGDEIDAATATPTTAATPFVGTWSSTDTDGRSRTMYIDQWDVDTYQVRVPSRAGIVCSRVGRPTTDGSLVITRFALPSPYIQPSCDGTTSPPTEELTFDRSGGTALLVDSSGGVWREQAAPPPEGADIRLLEAFLAARVDGEGAEQYVGQEVAREDLVPLLYATTSGAIYERFEVERAQDPDGTRVYDVRLFAEGGSVVQQRFQVTEDRLLVDYEGPTLEDGRAVPLPFSILDGEVTFGVASTWEVKNYQDDHVHLLQRFGSAVMVIAAEPLSVGSTDVSCDGPTPADASALARSIVSELDEASEAVPVRIGGIDGFQVDVAMPGRERPLCSFADDDTLVTVQSSGTRMRFFLVDHPGESATVLTFAFMTAEDEFGNTDGEIAQIIESIRIER